MLAGDPVNYYPGVHDTLNRDRFDHQPLAALIVRVNEDASLNLLVSDVRRGVRLPRNLVRAFPAHPVIEGYFVARAPSIELLTARIVALEAHFP